MTKMNSKVKDGRDLPVRVDRSSILTKRNRNIKSRLRSFRLFGILALPSLLLFGLGVLGPLALAFKYSFTDLNLLSGIGQWVGWRNYSVVLADPEFWHAFGFTLALTASCIFVANAGGLTFAVILNRQKRTFHFLRSLTFIPSVLAGVVVSYIWATILTDRGSLNFILGSIGLSGLQTSWLGSPLAAQISVIVVTSWPAIGFGTIIYLAGLQSVPKELLEAAAVDGAGQFRSFWSVTWPLLKAPLFVTTTMMLIGGFKAYDVSVILTGGGPSRATDTPALQIIRHGFIENRAGYANAQAVLLLLALLIVSVVGSLITSRGEKND